MMAILISSGAALISLAKQGRSGYASSPLVRDATIKDLIAQKDFSRLASLGILDKKNIADYKPPTN